MSLFKKPLFSGIFSQSTNNSAQKAFEKGVLHLNMGDYYGAREYFTEADKADHASACYNLMLINGSGYISPYNIDLAALHYYKAAKLDHARSKESIWQLEAADRGGFGVDNLADFAAKSAVGDSLPYMIMICAARFFSTICKQHGATDVVVAYELDCAKTSEMASVHSFVKRTGIQESFYRGGEHRLIEGSAADQITDGFNKLHLGLKHAGFSDDMCMMARCTIVGYIISKSSLGDNASPLLGLDKFFDDDLTKSQKSMLDPAPNSAKDKIKPKVFSMRAPPSVALTDLEFPAEVLLVTQSGKVLMTSENLVHKSHEHLDGAVFEIMVKIRNGDPIFIYYKCEEYYFSLMRSGSILESQKAQQWRANISEKALVFLRTLFLHTTQEDFGQRMLSYNHNAKHTNVVAYIERLDGWYPIQQNDSDHEDTTELRVSAVNSGTADISQFIAISDLSPNA